jgi:hypothetical protein
MAIGPTLIPVTVVAFMALLPISSDAAASDTIRAKFSVDGLATCQQPAVTNYPVHVEGTGVLSTDRSATLTLNSSMGSQETLTTRLGSRPSAAAGGSAALRVVSRHTLQAVREYANNRIIVYMTVVGNSCSIRVEHRLKPGKRQYTFNVSNGVALCSKPVVTRAQCTPY